MLIAILLSLAALPLLALLVAPAASDYMPARDADFEAWQQNFYAQLNASPGSYALDAPAVAALATLSTAFTTAYADVTNPATKTSVTVAVKDAEKAALKSYVRGLVAIIQASPAVTNAAKLNAGLPIHTNAPSPIPTPVTFPFVDGISTGPLIHTILYADQATPTSRRKPSGASALILCGEASETPIVDPSLLNFIKLVTRNPDTIQWDAAFRGKTIYYAGRWVTRTGLMGPWSAISTTVVA